MRLSTLFVAGLLFVSFAGCHSNQSYYDPFLGRTTVPPPGTIQTAPPGGPTYYQGAPPAGTVPMPSGVPAAVGAPVMAPGPPPGTPPPPGAYGVPQSSLERPKAMQTGPDEYVAGTSAIARRSPVVTAPAAQPPVTLTAGQSAPGPMTGQAWQPAATPATGPVAASGPAEPGLLVVPQ
jgi:hypothetical protein